MSDHKLINGFSRMNLEEKTNIVASNFNSPDEFKNLIKLHLNNNIQLQKFYEDLTENTISNFYLPYSIAPNFKINGKVYMVPMVIEESSVVAAASSGAKFWWKHGGFQSEVKNMMKPGHIHFTWEGETSVIKAFVKSITHGLHNSVKSIEQSMKKRGGGIKSIDLIDSTDKMKGYFQLGVLFNTSDAMGANFINTCLEKMADFLIQKADEKGISKKIRVIMSVLSNYTPECIVNARVSCNIREFENLSTLGYSEFAKRFETAVNMAQFNINRAVTHNKGIFNGIDAVLIATGNDFRAVEAAGHSWASKEGVYKGLSNALIDGNNFIFQLEIPMPLGVVGGLTNLHPLAKASLQLLGNPSSETLMSIVASVGLSNNFSAIKALITSGIQRGHMGLHLTNILKLLGVNESEKNLAKEYFHNRIVSHKDVIEFINTVRTENK